jgi:hypothetical protein
MKVPRMKLELCNANGRAENTSQQNRTLPIEKRRGFT